MANKTKYDISCLGEFVDNKLEKEFFCFDMKSNSRFVGPVALIFGMIFMLFIISDYFAIKNTYHLMVIFFIRALFLSASIALYIVVKKIKNYSSLAYIITGYEILAIIFFIMILYQYDTIKFISFFSLMAITLALYITPNRLINAQIVSILFNLSFYILFAKKVEYIDKDMLLKIIVYSIIFTIFGTTGAYLTNFYKRKQFADRRELFKLSITDSLTGIYNRVKFDQEIKKWIDYCNMNNDPLSLVMFDIDNFKNVNDNYGHIYGDAVIYNTTSLIKKAVRSKDIFARWGGEEFVILLPNTDIHQAMEITEKLRIYIQDDKYDNLISITCSFGLVSLQKNENADSLLKRADMFLYSAKKRGKNAVVCEMDNG